MSDAQRPATVKWWWPPPSCCPSFRSGERPRSSSATWHPPRITWVVLPSRPSENRRPGSSSPSCCFLTLCAPSTSRAVRCSCAAASTKWSTRPWAVRWRNSPCRPSCSTMSSPGPSAASAPDCTSAASSTRSESRFTGRSFTCIRPISPPYSPHCHHLLLAEEHHRHSGIQREGAAHHADHYGDGGDSDCVVPGHNSQERISAGAAASAGEPEVRPGGPGWLKGTIAPRLL